MKGRAPLAAAFIRALVACAIVACAIVAACTSVDGTAAAPVRYVCPGGALLLASFRSQQSVRLDVDDRVYALPRLISASGARYGEGGVTFWTKGREALLQRPDGPSYIGCVEQG